MTAATAAVDFDALDREAEVRIAELEGERQRLALDALTDAGARKRLAEVETQLSDAAQERERARLARVEAESREEQRQAEEEAQARAEGLRRARELETRRRRAAREVDKTAATLARALKAFDEIAGEQEQALRQAGWSSQAAMSARPRPWHVEAALRGALAGAAVPAALLRIEPAAFAPDALVPLVQGDVRVIEPAEPAQEGQG